MNMRLSPAWRPPVLSLVAILLLISGFTLFGRINSALLLDHIELSSSNDVAIRLDFEPERFHLEKFQNTGRYQGWSDGRAVILAAKPDALRRLARNYWIDTIEPYEVAK